MQPLVLLALAALQAALVGALLLPVGVVVNALPGLGLPTPGTCAPKARGERTAARSARPCTGPGSRATRREAGWLGGERVSAGCPPPHTRTHTPSRLNGK